MPKINKEFAGHVTSLAFNLSLSRQMIMNLVDIKNQTFTRDTALLLGFSHTSVPTGRRLQERGLVHAPNPKLPGAYELTEAGEHVIALLEIAGLVQTVEEARQRALEAAE